MGNAQVPRVEEPRVLLAQNPAYQGFAYQDVLGSYKLFKVMRCVHECEGDVVVKLFIHRDGQPDLIELQRRIYQVRDALRCSWRHPNVLPYQAMEISGQSSVLLRQHFVRHLNDRIHTRPFLSSVEKKWLSFQAMAAVCQAHSAGVAHGDLKTENFFISSWSHVVLTDFATFKPLMLPQDDPTEFSFFFESDRNRHRCYLAPERFDGSGGAGPSRGRFSRELAAMDIFSLGCVLSELFQDGQTLLDLPQLRAYRQGGDLREKLSGLDTDIQDLINSMLNRDPTRRKSAIEYLREWCDRIFPRSFSRCLFPLSVLMLHPLYSQPDMRVALLRHNFASLVWLTSGARPIGGHLGFRGKEDDVNVWKAWQKHVESNASNLDSVMHSIVTHGLQAASQCKPETFEATKDTSPASTESRSVLTQPLVNEAVCLSFTSTIFDLWEQGYKRCALSGQIDEGENQDSSVYVDFLTKSCENSNSSALSESPPGQSPSVGQDAEALSIICGWVTSCAQHVLTPRARYACLDMLQLLVPLSSQETLLEQIIPYSHVLMTDPVAKVRARSMDVLCSALAHVKELPSSHSPLFTEYILPQLMSMMSGMNHEPVVLLSVARNLGSLATHAQRCGEQLAAATQSQDAETEAFDVRSLQEALQKIVKALLDLLPGPFSSPSEKTNQEEHLMSLSISREVKIALLRNMCVLADCFGRECFLSFPLPYFISFMNDPAWEVRAAFCAEAALLPQRVGQVSSEGIIWPCYEQALLDQEERVLEAALSALTKFVKQRVLRRHFLANLANKVAPLLVHPSEQIRNNASQVVESLASELSPVDQYVFLLPAIRPYLLMETCSLQQVVLGLKQPWVPRELYQQVLVTRDESIFESAGGAPPHKSLDLLRPYLKELLRTRATLDARGDAPSMAVTAMKVQSLQYVTVNPHLEATRSLPCCAEAMTRDYHSWFPVMPKTFQHPLGFLSFQAYLVKAFCLPPKMTDLGSLSCLDGTPYSLYSMVSSVSSSARAETEAGAMALQESISQVDLADDAVDTVAIRHSSVAAWGVGRSPPQAWRPKGQLLTTLYEYAHQSGVPVVKVDTTDDSRVLVTGGRDGTVKLWCCAQLESDTAPSSFYSIPTDRDGPSAGGGGLRALRTIRNSKAFATASDDQVLLYRVESSRNGAKLVSRYQSQAAGPVMFIDQLDTELESLLLFAQAQGTLNGWDLRGPKGAWTLPVPPSLGLPLSLATQRLSVTVGTAGGGLLLYDLRFLRPWKQWKARAGIQDLRSADVASSHGVFAALSSQCNEVALFDVSQGSCLTLFLTDPTDGKPREALSVPSLTEIGPSSANFELPSSMGLPGVRSLWLPHGAQTSLLAAGVDRKVRHWSLDPERHIAEAYVVTPPETAERASYTSNHLGDVFVVQETSTKPTGDVAAKTTTEEHKPSPNHRDAILDLCSISLQHDILVTAGRDGLVKLWR